MNTNTLDLSRKVIFVLLINLSFTFSAQAQQETITLWENGIPGSKSSDAYKEQVDYKNDKINSLSKVTTPEMTVFTPQKANGTAVVICPGGGYLHLAIDKEGFKIGDWFAKHGVTAFVLKYRLPSNVIMQDKMIGPLQDAQRAMRIVRQNATKYNIDTSKVGIMGFSAGGHLASTLSTHYNDSVYDSEPGVSAKPDFSILLYPVISMQEEITHRGSRENLLGKNPEDTLVDFYSNEKQVNSATPITFLIHAADDNVVPVANSINYFTALNANHVKTEMHIYETGGHGFGLGTEETSNSWPDALALWLKKNDLIN